MEISILNSFARNIRNGMSIKDTPRIKRSTHNGQIIKQFDTLCCLSQHPGFIKQNYTEHIPFFQGKFFGKGMPQPSTQETAALRLYNYPSVYWGLGIFKFSICKMFSRFFKVWHLLIHPRITVWTFLPLPAVPDALQDIWLFPTAHLPEGNPSGL